MFDLAWSEIALIGVVALIVIGPKDLPGAIRGVAQMLGKARRMAGEFQTHVDEMVREAKLDEVKREIDQFRSNIQDEVYRATQVDELKRDIVDPLTDTMRDLERPFDQTAAQSPAASASTGGGTAQVPPLEAPRATPPDQAQPADADSAKAAAVAEPAPPAASPPTPAFIPPGIPRA